MRALPASAHSAVSNRTRAGATKRFFSREPFLGNGARHPTDPGGFEAIEGFRIKTPAGRKRPQLRSIKSLTYGSRFKSQTGKASTSQTQIIDTTLYPWRANCMLKITVPGKNDAFLGTGWFIGPYAVITAAHAVYPREPGVYTGWASLIEVIPGANGSSGASAHNPASSSLFYCPDGWQSDGDLRLDYAAIILNEGVGSQVGSYGYATYSDADLLSAVSNLAGYPELKSDRTPADGTQWYAAGNVVSVDESFIYYYLGAQGGESGSCVYRNIGDQSYAMAIHIGAQEGIDPATTLDRGLRITEPVFENLQNWASMSG
jgi:glutamyl endopeptidase